MAHVDIHTHVLPGVDDGARSIEQSLAMIAAAAADGTRAMVATPHVRGDFVTDVSDLPARLDELRAAVDAAGLRVDLHGGAELGHDMVGRLSQADLEAIALGPAGHRWLLVESPFAGIGAELEAAASELRDRGFGVVLAHPERAAGAADDPDGALARELAQGTRLQLNAHSLTGGYGAAAERAAHRLLERGGVAAIASDTHPGWRTPALSTAAEALRRGGGDGHLARRLIGSGPQALVARGLPAPAPAAA